jgi:hypothetical protein
VTVEPRTLHTDDAVALEAEWSAPPAPRVAAVLCHPHPAYGGTMRSIVISALFDALPARGAACLRFNFRGVERSGGVSSAGRDEPRDVLAAVAAAARDAPDVPLVLAGWSFGADMALRVADPRVAAWTAIAPPLRFGDAAGFAAVAHDRRPKLFVLAARDEFRAPAEVTSEVAGWEASRVEVVAGASHFFVGRTSRVVAAVDGFLRQLEESEPSR